MTSDVQGDRPPYAAGRASEPPLDPMTTGSLPIVPEPPRQGSGVVGLVLDPSHEQTTRMARIVGPVFVLSAAILVPWTVYLYVTLPTREVSHNYALAWAGFDVGLVLALVAATWALVRLSRLLPIAASALGTLLLVDAWFDIVTSRPGNDRLLAVVMALLAELPLAAVAYWMAYHGQALRERAIAVRLVRAVRRGRPIERSVLRRLVRRPRG